MCKQCKLKPVYVFTNKRQVCKACFIRWFYKKVFYAIKKFEMAKKGDVIGYKLGKGFRQVVLQDALRIYESKAPVDLVKVPTTSSPTNSCPAFDINKGQLAKVKTLAHPKKLRITKLAIPTTTDQEAEKIVEGLIKGNLNKLRVSPVDGKIIKPLYLFLDKEVILYAKLKRLKFTRKHEKKSKFFIIINELEKKHPEIKHAILNSYLKLSN